MFSKQLKGMQTYLRTPVSKSLIETIGGEMETPWLVCKYSGVKTPKTYSNSPGSPPRYYVSGVIDIACPAHARFIDALEKIRLSAKADGFLTIETKGKGSTRETTGNHLLKFQSKESPAVYVLEKGKEEEVDLEGEIPSGMLMKVTFQARRYMNKHTSTHSLTFPPSKILLLPADEEIPHCSWDRPSDSIKFIDFNQNKKSKKLESPKSESEEKIEVKTGRGRPKKETPNPKPETESKSQPSVTSTTGTKRGRGRPKKDPSLTKLSKPSPKKITKTMVETKRPKETEAPKPKPRKITSDFADSVRSGLKDKKKAKTNAKK